MTTNDSPRLTNFFSSNPHYGTPDAITAAGCIALVKEGSSLWDEWRAHYPVQDNKKPRVNFENHIFDKNECFQDINFGDDASFAGATFKGSVEFKECIFGENANFTKTLFEGDFLFEGVVFADEVDFSEAAFKKKASFKGSEKLYLTFYKSPIFLKTTFNGDVLFQVVSFQEGVDFSGAIFGNFASFKNGVFSKPAIFEKATFNGGASFEAAIFQEVVDFSGAEFKVKITFKTITFPKKVLFKATKFNGGVSFEGVTFQEFVDFSGAEFEKIAVFKKTNPLKVKKLIQIKNFYKLAISKKKFNGGASFKKTIFEKESDFSKTTWHGEVRFEDINWGANTNFSEAIFKKSVHFLGGEKEKQGFLSVYFEKAQFDEVVDFSNMKFKGETRFTGVKFSAVPEFHGCDVYQNTSFEGADFPPATGDHKVELAYRALKFSFNKLQAVREEQRFFGLELAEEAKRKKGIERLFFWGYHFFSDYGFSIRRPVFFILGIFVVMTAIYSSPSFWANECWYGGCGFSIEIVKFSVAHTFSLIDSSLVKDIDPPPSWPKDWTLLLTLLTIVHKILFLGALFLLGLACRNLFKLK